jgi:hypothetical protein
MEKRLRKIQKREQGLMINQKTNKQTNKQLKKNKKPSISLRERAYENLEALVCIGLGLRAGEGLACVLLLKTRLMIEDLPEPWRPATNTFGFCNVFTREFYT